MTDPKQLEQNLIWMLMDFAKANEIPDRAMIRLLRISAERWALVLDVERDDRWQSLRDF